jgi:hypothetical protein
MDDSIGVTERAEELTVNNEPLTTSNGRRTIDSGQLTMDNPDAGEDNPRRRDAATPFTEGGLGTAELPVVRGNLCESEPCDPFLMGLRSKY